MMKAKTKFPLGLSERLRNRQGSPDQVISLSISLAPLRQIVAWVRHRGSELGWIVDPHLQCTLSGGGGFSAPTGEMRKILRIWNPWRDWDFELTKRKPETTLVSEMETPNSLVEIPPSFAALAGTVDSGTRIFRADGTQEEMTKWFDALCEHIGACVSPGGAAVYSGTSRPGVYKRLKAGKMTAFCFHIVGRKKNLFGGGTKLKALPLVYIPVSECQAWKAELEMRFARIHAGKVRDDAGAMADAFEGEHTGEMHDFLNYDPKDEAKSGVKYVGRVEGK